jgi:hypothetical protein
MNPHEIKAKLDAVDAELKTKLRELGFTEAEIDRQLDNSIPAEVRKAEAEQILGRKFVADLNDPNSGLMDSLIDRVIDEAEKEHPGIKAELEAERRRVRRNKIIAAIVAVAAIVAGVWYFALRDTRSNCEKMLGPLSALGKQAGKTFKKGLDYKSDRTCELTIDDKPFTGTQMDIEMHRSTFFEQRRRELDKGGYASSEKLGDGWLYIAAKQKERSAEEMMADAQSRVGRSRDPIGDVLAAGGPSQHVALFEAGAWLVIVKMSNRTFSPELAKTIAVDMAARAKSL